MGEPLTPYFKGRKFIAKLTHQPTERRKVELAVYEEWDDIFSTTLMCGNASPFSFTYTLGVSKTDQETLSSTLNLGASVLGVLKAKSDSKAENKTEVRLEEGIERTTSFELAAPPHGKKITVIYQLKTLIEIEETEDSRFPWIAPVKTHRKVTAWQQRFDDQTRVIDPHEDCSPPAEDSDTPPEGSAPWMGPPVRLSLGNGVTFTGDAHMTPVGPAVPELGLQFRSVPRTLGGLATVEAASLPAYLPQLIGSEEPSLEVAVLPTTDIRDFSAPLADPLMPGLSTFLAGEHMGRDQSLLETQKMVQGMFRHMMPMPLDIEK